jgi:hypothetical protein
VAESARRGPRQGRFTQVGTKTAGLRPGHGQARCRRKDPARNARGGRYRELGLPWAAHPGALPSYTRNIRHRCRIEHLTASTSTQWRQQSKGVALDRRFATSRQDPSASPSSLPTGGRGSLTAAFDLLEFAYDVVGEGSFLLAVALSPVGQQPRQRFRDRADVRRAQPSRHHRPPRATDVHLLSGGGRWSGSGTPCRPGRPPSSNDGPSNPTRHRSCFATTSGSQVAVQNVSELVSEVVEFWERAHTERTFRRSDEPDL